MKCPRCLNENQKYFYLGSKGWYCRLCISFKRKLLIEEDEEFVSSLINTTYELPFSLTEQQKDCSQKLCSYIQNEDVLIHAACGAGKTEIVMECIKQSLKLGLSVGVAIPRRQVVLEIAKRMQKAFCDIRVTPVCSGFTNIVDGDLIVCTTHQLYRYPKKFDILILDEPDAFPYKNNLVLQGIVKTSCKGRMVYLTATPNQDLYHLKTIALYKRPHGYPLPEPKVVIGFQFYLVVYLVIWLRNRRKVLIFVPTIQLANQISKLLCVEALTSKSEEKEKKIENFINETYRFLVCTTILERGITLSNVNVCIFYGNHMVFDEASIIQIMGRLGRDPLYPKGDGLILCLKKTQAVMNSIKRIHQMNV